MIEKFRWRDVKAEDVKMEGSRGVKVRWLINEARGARNFSMRVFELAPEGYTPYHQHANEHEVLVLEGQGILRTETGDRPLESGDVVWVPPNEHHQFRNAGNVPFFFECVIPMRQA